MKLTVAADANFGLVHKVHSGTGIGPSRDLKFFFSDEAVLDFMQNYDDSRGSFEQVCLYYTMLIWLP